MTSQRLCQHTRVEPGSRTALTPLHDTRRHQASHPDYIRYAGYMDNDSAIAALGALAQGTRLDVFRLLVRHEPDGMAAGEIARQLDVPQNTMSAHLGILSRAGIVRFERQSRSIIYRADMSGLRALTLFLVKDCCAGSPELCTPLLAELTPCC
jgi:ArsR family transcriptional regulator